MNYMKKNILLSLVLVCAVACVGKVDLPEFDTPPHLQGTEQEEGKDEGKDDGKDDGKEEETPSTPEASGDPMTVRFISYNVGKFAKYEKDLGHKSYPEVAAVIKEIGGTVVGLNETNSGQANELAKALGAGWTGYFAYAANTTYGNSIVADPKYKVVKEYPRVAIPKVDANTSEVRSLGVVEYEDFVFCVTHLDHMSIEARKSGVDIITKWALENYGPGKTSKPVILLGDMNCIPAEVTITKFKENWDWVSANEYSFPCPNPTKCIDFVFVLKNGVKYTKGDSHAVHSTTTTDITKASDHYPVYADITFNAQK